MLGHSTLNARRPRHAPAVNGGAIDRAKYQTLRCESDAADDDERSSITSVSFPAGGRTGRGKRTSAAGSNIAAVASCARLLRCLCPSLNVSSFPRAIGKTASLCIRLSLRFDPYIGQIVGHAVWEAITARKVKDKDLGDRTARSRLPIRGKPYYRSVETGLHIGFRRLRGRSGTWAVRHYIGDQQYVVEAIGTADDNSDADGVTVLSFDQAVSKARELHTRHAKKAAGISGPWKVKDAIDAYTTDLDRRGKQFYAYEKQAGRYILPKLGDVEIVKLTAEQLQEWLADVAAMPSKAKGRKFDPRARKDSANRVWTILRSALRLAAKQRKVSADLESEWRRVEPFENVSVSRDRFLSVAEARRLINACDSDFRVMVEAALATGARYGELCRLECRDFHPDSGTVSIRFTKTGRPRKVVLTPEGQRLFKALIAGRDGSDPLIRRDDGLPFAEGHQARRMQDACERAGIKPAVGFHQLRHSFASLCVQAGMPLAYVAKALGHVSTAMVEKHYGHLDEDDFAKAIRANAPTFGIGKKSNVTAIR